ncbi:MAG: sigma-70 family RNA polymerase sigma factor [Actinomycetota bacterium]
MRDTPDRRSDGQLVHAAKDGDFGAFGELVRRHQRDAIRIAAIALGSSTGADDTAQEAFIKAHRSLHRFREDAPFRPWLFRIVTNTARNRLRHEGRQSNLRTRVAVLATSDPASPEEIAGHLADRDELVAAINRLEVADRLILAYRWYHQMTEAEIAEAMGCRRGTAKSRLSRAMNRLRLELEES